MMLGTTNIKFRKLITVFTRAGHLSLSWARSIQCAPPSSSYYLKIHFINFILPRTGTLGCPSCILPQVSLPNPCAPVLSLLPFLSHAPSIWFFFIWPPKYYLLSRPDHGARHYAVLLSHITSSVLGPNIFLNTPFSNTLSLCFSLIVRDQVSLPCKTTSKMMIMIIMIMMIIITITIIISIFRVTVIPIFSRQFSIFWPSGFEMARICRKCTSTKQHLYKWKSEIQDWANWLTPVIVCYLSALTRCCVTCIPQVESLPAKYSH
jgi:hypothetical protein